MSITEQMLLDSDRPKIIGVNKRHFPTKEFFIHSMEEVARRVEEQTIARLIVKFAGESFERIYK